MSHLATCQFAAVGDGDFSLGLADHAAVDFNFIVVEAGESALGVDAVDADEEDVDKDAAHAGDGGGADEGEPVAAEMAAGDEDLNVFAVAELHGDVDGVGDDGDAAEGVEAADNFRGGGSGGEGDGVAGGDELRGGEGDAALFVGEAADLILEGAVVAEGLVEERLDGDGSAMGAAEEAGRFKVLQVAADGGKRDIEFVAQGLDGGRACVAELLEDDRGPRGLLVAALRHGFSFREMVG